MKTIFLTVIVVATLASCGNKKEAEAPKEDGMSIKEMTTEEVVTIAPEFQKGADLIAYRVTKWTKKWLGRRTKM